jgi:hypothetical protein
MRSDGKTPLYGTSAPTKNGKMEKWVSILEKAIAVSQGGYDAIGDDGGVSSDVMEMITGKKSMFYSTYNMSFKTLQRQVNAGHPVSAATRSEKKEELYKGTNIFPWHVYTVLGTEVKDGKQYVTLRNPWGDTEPGNDGVDDGIFKLTFADFKKYYIDVYVNEA